jgi:hypothetical protein
MMVDNATALRGVKTMLRFARRYENAERHCAALERVADGLRRGESLNTLAEVDEMMAIVVAFIEMVEDKPPLQ